MKTVIPVTPQGRVLDKDVERAKTGTNSPLAFLIALQIQYAQPSDSNAINARYYRDLYNRLHIWLALALEGE